MGIEYHGWLALATSQADWSDGDFNQGFQHVKELLRRLRPENGHEPLMPDGAVLPQVIYLKGHDVESLDPVLHVVQQIVAVFDRSYGELVGFGGDGEQDSSFDMASATRYRIIRGQVIGAGPSGPPQ